jgi:Zn-dependent peptidase ImmA (M78 family)
MSVRRARLRKIVEQLLTDAKVKAPPVPVDQLIRSQGVEITRKRFDDETSGLIYVDVKTGHAVVGLNVSHSKTRQRFTLAHELGHFLLHKQNEGGLHVDDRDFFIKFRDHHSSDGSDREEREANAFAAELLMPSSFLERDAKKLREGLSLSDETAVRELASRYGVSLQALSFRLVNLGLIDAAILG